MIAVLHDDIDAGETPATRTIQRAYQAEIDPTKAQIAALRNHVGASRFVYNWGLRRRIDYYQETGKTLGYYDQSRELTILKQGDCPWLYEVSNAALQNSLRNLDAAYKNFFRRVKQGGEKPGFPRFKSRDRGKSFKVNRPVRVHSGAIQVPRIGLVRLKQRDYLPVEGIRITSATIREWAGRWYVSIQVEEEIPVREAEGPTLAVHLGVRKLATISDGTSVTTVENPLALTRSERKLKREQRALSRKKPGSNNRAKQREKVARVHRRVVNVRRDAMHQATTAIVRQGGALVVEDWDVKGMLEDGKHRIARRIADASMAEFRRALLYKADWAGVPVDVLDRGLPSSRRCAQCGAVKEEELRTIIYHCEVCGWEADREHNAVLNLLAEHAKRV